MLKVVALFLQYGDKYQGAFNYFKTYCNMVDIPIFKIIIDNKIETQFCEQIQEDAIKINGNNAEWEFSGWDAGLEWLKNNNVDYDVCLFVNDAFLMPPNNIDAIINDKTIETCFKENALIGEGCPSLGKNFGIQNIQINDWVRTHCFLLPKKIIDEMKTVKTFDSSYKEVLFDKKTVYKANDILSIDFKKHLIEWIGGSWHSAINIQENFELFKSKALAHLNELMLTAKMKKKHTVYFIKPNFYAVKG